MSTYTEERTARHALEDAREDALIALAFYCVARDDYPMPSDVLAALCPTVPLADVERWFSDLLRHAARCPDHLRMEFAAHPSVRVDVEYMTGARR